MVSIIPHSIVLQSLYKLSFVLIFCINKFHLYVLYVPNENGFYGNFKIFSYLLISELKRKSLIPFYISIL